MVLGIWSQDLLRGRSSTNSCHARPSSCWTWSADNWVKATDQIRCQSLAGESGFSFVDLDIVCFLILLQISAPARWGARWRSRWRCRRTFRLWWCWLTLRRWWGRGRLGSRWWRWVDDLFDITLADKDDEWLCAHEIIMASICYPFMEWKSHLLAKVMFKK